MEIPQKVQDKLKCNECDELLSCGPVYLSHETGGTICGRCSQQSEDPTENKHMTRIEPYEAVASLLAFPCAHAARGCPEKHSFTLGQPPHELNCKFRPIICPIAPRGSCDWIGSWPDLKEHSDDKHASSVLKNKSEIPRPDLTFSNLQTYLISAFQFLFLLHVKVCVTSGKLFHSLRMFGNSESLDKFSYSLEIKGNKKKLIEEGSVVPSGLMTLQEPSANSILINSLMGILDSKYEESKFTITIQTSITFNCLNCSKIIENVSDLCFCNDCLVKLIKCEFYHSSCSFVDADQKKCEKHAIFFCKYQTKCCVQKCGANFVGGFNEHLTSANCCRETISSDINSVVRVTNTNTNSNFILFSTNKFGIIIGEYYLSKSEFKLNLLTSLPSFQLKKIKCSIKLTDPQTKHFQVLTPQIEYNEWCDWKIKENLGNFPSWRDIGIDIKVTIDKI